MNDYILNLSLIYPYFLLIFILTPYSLLLTPKIWAHIFVMQGEPFGRTACPKRKRDVL